MFMTRTNCPAELTNAILACTIVLVLNILCFHEVTCTNDLQESAKLFDEMIKHLQAGDTPPPPPEPSILTTLKVITTMIS